MGDSEAAAEAPAAESAPAEPAEPAPEAPTPEKAPSEPAPDAHPPAEPAAPGAPEAPKAGVEKDTAVSFSQKPDTMAKPAVKRRSSVGQPQRSSKVMGRLSKERSTLELKEPSGMNLQERAKIPKYMNSYKLQADNPFNADKVHRIIVQVLNESIEDSMVYDSDSCPAKARSVCGLLRTRIKEQDFDRYKLVCLVTIGEKKSYDIFAAVRFLWDSEKDSFATHVHENMYVYVVASVFGLYYE